MDRVRLTKQCNIPFAAPEGIPLYLDVVRPVQADGVPVILSVFGGGWCSGDRTTLGAASHRLARQGFMVVCIDYRLAPAHPFPAATTDILSAVQWIHEHAQEYGGDVSRLGAFGVSAGGHLIALLATMLDSPLCCAVSWGGPMDLRSQPVTDKYRSYPLAFLGSCPHDDPDRYISASPVCHVSPQMPPVLLLHGTDDEVVPLRQSHDMLHSALNAGANIELHELPGAAHEPGDPRDPIMAAAWERLIGFFQAHLLDNKLSLRC